MLHALLLLASSLLVDGRGRSLSTSTAPTRIASCTLGSDEMLVELLKRSGRSANLVAVSTTADAPAISNLVRVPALPKGRCGGELEALLALHPDLAILASYNRPEMVTRLEAAGVKTFVMGDFANLHDLQLHLRQLGQLVHAESAAAALSAELDARAKALAPLPTAPRVVEFFPDGTVSGSGTLFDDLVRRAGGHNAAADLGLKGWPQLGAEALAALQIDAVVVSGEPAERAKLSATVQQAPGWRLNPAVRAGHIIVVPARALGAASQYAWTGLEDLHKGLAALARAQPPAAGAK